MGLKGYNIGEGGEIVEVQGGHIIRPTGLKDRHSKVLTSKGPRDRRVRLSAHTAIQFYDVQDRLGYDRPSKAVDWLIKKAKTAIDRLGETTTNNGQELGSPNLVDQTQFMEVNLDTEENNNIVSRTRTTTPNLSQDLGLSLHSFQGNNNVETNNFTTNHFETLGRISGWNHHQDLTMRSSSSSSEQEERGFLVNHHQFHQQQVFLDGQQQQQRGTLQSSLFHQMTPDHHHHHNYHNQTSPVMFASSAQYGSHGMMMMQGLSFPNTSRLLHGEEANQPNTSSSSSTPPNSHL